MTGLTTFPHKPPPIHDKKQKYDPILGYGPLTLKRTNFGAAVDRYLLLAAPKSVLDVETVFAELYERPAWAVIERASNEDMTKTLGQIAKAAVEGCPLLVLMPMNRARAEQTEFIHMSDVCAISDEQDLKSPCHFMLHLASKARLRFSAPTSVAYKYWLKALLPALKAGADARTTRMERIMQKKDSPPTPPPSATSPSPLDRAASPGWTPAVDGVYRDAATARWVAEQQPPSDRAVSPRSPVSPTPVPQTASSSSPPPKQAPSTNGIVLDSVGSASASQDASSGLERSGSSASISSQSASGTANANGTTGAPANNGGVAVLAYPVGYYPPYGATMDHSQLLAYSYSSFHPYHPAPPPNSTPSAAAANTSPRPVSYPSPPPAASLDTRSLSRNSLKDSMYWPSPRSSMDFRTSLDLRTSIDGGAAPPLPQQVASLSRAPGNAWRTASWYGGPPPQQGQYLDPAAHSEAAKAGMHPYAYAYAYPYPPGSFVAGPPPASVDRPRAADAGANAPTPAAQRVPSDDDGSAIQRRVSAATTATTATTTTTFSSFSAVPASLTASAPAPTDSASASLRSSRVSVTSSASKDASATPSRDADRESVASAIPDLSFEEEGQSALGLALGLSVFPGTNGAAPVSPPTSPKQEPAAVPEPPKEDAAASLPATEPQPEPTATATSAEDTADPQSEPAASTPSRRLSIATASSVTVIPAHRPAPAAETDADDARTADRTPTPGNRGPGSPDAASPSPVPAPTSSSPALPALMLASPTSPPTSPKLPTLPPAPPRGPKAFFSNMVKRFARSEGAEGTGKGEGAKGFGRMSMVFSKN
ncbi:hypothetical protein HDU96_011095 [Phlyctochytrium bullatum]|nr:hypothetical protein HDU96_011095 [Phlyctochytrium bullatum]